MSTGTSGGMSGSACKITALTRFARGGYDAAEMPQPEGQTVTEPEPSATGAPGERRGRCPTCGRVTSWKDNRQRPFCSLTCRLIDLGVWLDEGYVVPDEPPDDVR